MADILSGSFWIHTFIPLYINRTIVYGYLLKWNVGFKMILLNSFSFLFVFIMFILYLSLNDCFQVWENDRFFKNWSRFRHRLSKTICNLKLSNQFEIILLKPFCVYVCVCVFSPNGINTWGICLKWNKVVNLEEFLYKRSKANDKVFCLIHYTKFDSLLLNDLT